MNASRPAAFLDRDGTIIVDAEYISDPGGVALLPDAGKAIAALNRAAVPVVVVSNQSGIARGYYTLSDFERVQQRVEELLAAEGAQLDGVYICPHAPAAHAPERCECRKPGTLLYRRAAAEHAFDLARSFYVGDRWRDIAPFEALGGRGILVPAASTPPEEVSQARARASVVPSLLAAAALILGSY